VSAYRDHLIDVEAGRPFDSAACYAMIVRIFPRARAQCFLRELQITLD
jgi:hypothetical protein